MRRDGRTVDVRRPTSIDEALADCLDAIADPLVMVTPTNELFVDLLSTLKRAAS